MSINARNINATGAVIFKSATATVPADGVFTVEGVPGFPPDGMFTVFRSGPTDTPATVDWQFTNNAVGSNLSYPEQGAYVVQGNNLFYSGNIDMANSGFTTFEFEYFDPEQPANGGIWPPPGSPGSVETAANLADVIAQLVPLPDPMHPDFVPETGRLDPFHNRRVLVTFIDPVPLSSLTIEATTGHPAGWPGAILYTDMSSAPVYAFYNDAVITPTTVMHTSSRKFRTYTNPTPILVKAILLTAYMGPNGMQYYVDGPGSAILPIITPPEQVYGLYTDFVPVTSGTVEFGNRQSAANVEFVYGHHAGHPYDYTAGVTISNPSSGTVGVPSTAVVVLSPAPQPELN